MSASASVVPQSISGSSAVNGTALDTKGYNTGVLRAYAVAASGSPSAATITVKLQECATSNGTFTDALDNTGTVIGFTLTTTSADGKNEARVEGLGLNRKRYIRAVATPAFTSGTSPASVTFAEVVMGRSFQRPTDTTVSNT